MKKMSVIKAAVALLLGLLIISCSDIMQNDKAAPAFEQTNLIVKVADKVSPGEVDSLIPGTRLKTIASFDGYNSFLYQTDGSEHPEKILNRLKKNKKIAALEKEQVYTHFLVPNDTNYNIYQYAPVLTNCEAAWDTYTGSVNVVVAVIDTGINGEHLDFGAKVINGYNSVIGVPITAAANSDDNGHGTHVAGIIGAVGNNNQGIAGVAWQTTLMPVKVLDGFGSGMTSTIVAGIVWAVDNGADIINMSLGSIGYSQLMADAVDYAVSHNITVVVAMGNDGFAIKNYPAGYNGVIAVGSTNAKDAVSVFSTKGTHISVSAPGENIYSLSDSSNNGYLYMSGTSMACPFVSGLAALLLAKDGTLLPAEIRSIIEDSSIDRGAAGFDQEYGYGRVDVNAALNLAKRNNYGRIRVLVNVNSVPYEGAEVLLLNSTGTQVIKTALTSAGANGGAVGEVDFAVTRTGTYQVAVRVGGETRMQSNIILTSGADEFIQFDYTIASSDFIIETFPNGGADQADTFLVLYDESMTQLASDDDGAAMGYYSSLTYTLHSGSTYYIQILDLYSTPGYYSLMVSPTGGGSSTVTPLITAGEPDDTPAQAAVINIDTVCDRHLSLGEVDFFKITIP